ncbi:MAG: hypothetical protein Q4B98_09080 [Cutibacterium sp.]|nr:hypothetical protein [Cutibacterium sp.]MDO4413173.1 hypothetical protein [Cutibacterium sp.]
MVLLLAPLLLLSGCGKLNVGFVIKDENHIGVAITVGVLKSALNEFTAGASAEVLKEFRDCSKLKHSFDGIAAGTMTVRPFDNDSHVGCTVTGTMTARELSGQSSPTTPSQSPSRSFQGEGPVFIAFDDDKIRFHVDGLEVLDAFPELGFLELGSTSRTFNFKVSVTFPGEVLSHSESSKVDGKTVTWTSIEDLESYSGLEASGKRQGEFPGWAWVVLGVLIAAGGGAVAAVVTSSVAGKKKKDESS